MGPGSMRTWDSRSCTSSSPFTGGTSGFTAERTELKVSRAPRRLGVALVGIGFLSASLLGMLLHRTTNAALPYLDSATTSTSLVAQWMMTKKLLENWLVWVAVDVVYIGMFIYKSLYVTAALYLVFLMLSVMGYRQWKATLHVEPVLVTAPAV